MKQQNHRDVTIRLESPEAVQALDKLRQQGVDITEYLTKCIKSYRRYTKFIEVIENEQSKDIKLMFFDIGEALVKTFGFQEGMETFDQLCELITTYKGLEGTVYQRNELKMDNKGFIDLKEFIMAENKRLCVIIIVFEVLDLAITLSTIFN